MPSRTRNVAVPPKIVGGGGQRQVKYCNLTERKYEDARHNSVPDLIPVQSTLDLIEACKFNEHEATVANASTDVYNDGDADFSSCLPSAAGLTSEFSWALPGLRSSGASTVQSNAQRLNSNFTHSKSPPAYDMLQTTVEKNGSPRTVVNRRLILRRKLAANQEVSEQIAENDKISGRHHPSSEIPRVPPHITSSPKSMRSDSTFSVDSGQCSGDVALTSQQSFSSSKEDRDDKEHLEEPSSIFHFYQQRCLPGYARIASTMDHVLRMASSISSLLSAPSDPSTAKDLLEKTNAFIQIIEASPCAQHLPKYDTGVVKLQVNDLQRESAESGRPLGITNYFTIVLRKMIEQVLQIFCKIITRYLTECSNKDRLVLIALEHFIHLILFGDELCLEAIQCGGLNSVLKLVKQPSTPSDTCQLLLRALAVLCGVSKGCLTLLALGGQEVVLTHLSSNSIPSSIEAAGVLTQLTNPQHAFVQLQNLEPILTRLLELIDICDTGETLLLVSAALSNASLQDPYAIDILYRQNTIARLINAYNRQDCSTIFVQEQIVTILCRLAARRYEEALISQGAVPMLLEMLTVTDSKHSDYCKRIRYKAAVCIGTLAATGIGLKSLYVNKGFAILTYVLEMENSPANPLNMICTNIRNRLETKYQIESTV
ncbi:hypothetical protein KIN20_010569 [Parelaphostrongylus tenuis]|uniref:Protein inscuteable homologue C-terminal domain-containing protein n=1 Tax=Parelaphostrongylus tenuis TaxID=148309 RepID=A0AAD5QLG1_PARTN|nr:hypothetical protein KIN20_010569 [Parelaphostrongylus tenuis]